MSFDKKQVFFIVLGKMYDSSASELLINVNLYQQVHTTHDGDKLKLRNWFALICMALHSNVGQ